MKKALLILSLCILSFPVWALQAPQTENYILNDNSQQVLSTQGINDPIRDGAYKIINSDPNTPGGSGSLVGIIWVNNQITDHQTAKNNTLAMAQRILNYALWLLSLVALIYLIINGVMVMTAAGDDTQYKKGLKSIKNAIIALAGIGASRLIVSLIFWLISQFIL